MSDFISFANVFVMIFLAAAVCFWFRNNPAGERRVKPLIGHEIFGLSVRQIHWILFAVIMVIAFFVRVWRFGSVPGGFNQDGAMGALDALALSQYGTDRLGMWMPAHLTAWGYGQMSALLSYLTVPFIRFFGLNPITARLPMLITSMLALWTLYLLTKDMLGDETGLVVLAFAAICPWHVMQSRWALDCNLFPHFVLFAVYFLHRGASKGKPFYAYLSMLFFALSMYCYGIAFYLIPLFLIAACIFLLVTKKLNWKQALICAGVFFLFAWPIIGVMIVNFFQLQTISLPFVTIPYFEDTVRTNDLLFFAKEPLRQLGLNAKAFLNIVLLQKPDSAWNAVTGFGSIYLFSLPLVLFGGYRFYKASRAKEDKTGFGLIAIWLALAVFSGLVVSQVNTNRINIVFYPLLFLGGYGIYELVTVKRNKRVLAGIGAVYLCFFLLFSGSYFGPNNEIVSEAFFEGFGDAVQAVEQSEADRIFITNYTQSENAGHVSEVMTQFYSQMDSKYVLGEAERTGTDGEALLPYKSRYKYVSFKRTKPDANDRDVAYVVNNKELNLFDQSKFKVETFQYYSAVMPK